MFQIVQVYVALKSTRWGWFPPMPFHDTTCSTEKVSKVIFSFHMNKEAKGVSSERNSVWWINAVFSCDLCTSACWQSVIRQTKGIKSKEEDTSAEEALRFMSYSALHVHCGTPFRSFSFLTTSNVRVWSFFSVYMKARERERERKVWCQLQQTNIKNQPKSEKSLKLVKTRKKKKKKRRVLPICHRAN